MKFYIFLLLAITLTVTHSVRGGIPSRYKRRGVGLALHPSSMSMRHPVEAQQFMKKLNHQQLNKRVHQHNPAPHHNNNHHHYHHHHHKNTNSNPIRASRPIPVHMPQSHKIPIGNPTHNNNIHKRPHVIAPPVRNFWKNTQTTYRTPSPSMIPEKTAFLSSPSIGLGVNNNQEYDFHIQTNNIPTLANPIKQIGEKGPIHTIPAPNLSPADRPANSPYQLNNQNDYQQAKLKQYQVSEAPEQQITSKYLRNQAQSLNIHEQQYQQQKQQQQQQQYQQQQQEQQQQQQQYQQQQQEKQQQQQQYQQQQQEQQQQQQQYQQQQQEQYQQQQQQEAYALSLIEQQQQETYAVPVIQQQVVDSHIQPQYVQALLQQQQPIIHHQPQIYQEIVQVHHPTQRLEATDKMGHQMNPEMHSFNYREESIGKTIGLSPQELSSLVTAAYNLDSNHHQRDEKSENVGASGTASGTIAHGSLAQSQYVQNYFDTTIDDDDDDGKKVEPDAKPSRDSSTVNSIQDEDDNDKISYSSLPNKRVADTLASLQAAGGFNSNLNNLSVNNNKKSSSSHMSNIYVPDDINGNGNKSDYNDSEYDDDYASQDDLTMAEDENGSFGDKLQPKNQ